MPKRQARANPMPAIRKIRLCGRMRTSVRLRRLERHGGGGSGIQWLTIDGCMIDTHGMAKNFQRSPCHSPNSISCPSLGSPSMT